MTATSAMRLMHTALIGLAATAAGVVAAFVTYLILVDYSGATPVQTAIVATTGAIVLLGGIGTAAYQGARRRATGPAQDRRRAGLSAMAAIATATAPLVISVLAVGLTFPLNVLAAAGVIALAALVAAVGVRLAR